MILLTLELVIAFAAGLPFLLFIQNLRQYRPPVLPLKLSPSSEAAEVPEVSLLIAARNEADVIERALRAAMDSVGVDLEIIVLDDDSTDATAQIVERVAARDARVRLEKAPALPVGWCGKQHACWVLAHLARRPVLAFIDADVSLSRDGLVRAVRFLDDSGADLISGIPHQVTGTWLEKALIPLIHFLLLGFLPLGRMRASRLPAYGAGCGQLFIARREAYEAAGGHRAIRASLHDGIMLPRAFRRAGFRTDLFDADAVASCRMYHSAAAVWRGLEKNATEGMAAPATIVPWTVLLLSGQVFPMLAIIFSFGARVVAGHQTIPRSLLLICAGAAAAGYAMRVAAAARFGQSWLGVVLHPLGVALLIVIQWQSLVKKVRGRPTDWRGRQYPSSAHPLPSTTSPAPLPHAARGPI